MWRSILLLYPFLVVYVVLAMALFAPVTWATRSIRPVYWAARQGCRIGLRLVGVRVDIRNLPYAYRQPQALFVANHVSNLEPPALFGALPRIAAITKRELLRIPMLGSAMRLGGFIGVDRKAKESRKEALEQALATLRRGISLLVFPEGTRNPGGPLLPFRPGPFQIAIASGVPVVPITVHGAAELMPKGTWFVRPGRIVLVFHPPVATAHLNLHDRMTLMRQIRETMQDALDTFQLSERTENAHAGRA